MTRPILLTHVSVDLPVPLPATAGRAYSFAGNLGQGDCQFACVAFQGPSDLYLTIMANHLIIMTIQNHDGQKTFGSLPPCPPECAPIPPQHLSAHFDRRRVALQGSKRCKTREHLLGNTTSHIISPQMID